MTAADLITGLIIAAAIGAAAYYLVQSRKKGVKCVGCPEGVSCAQKNKGECTCSVPEDFKIEK